MLTVLAGDDKFYPHNWSHLETEVEIINTFGRLGLEDIIVYIDDIFFCNHCLEKRGILKEKILLMETSNWMEELKKIIDKHKGHINVTNISK